ncbi:unnamed protein product [Auanema sp. JU1783]|nr:unnamed protein product [Auanema sp. JU1783]
MSLFGTAKPAFGTNPTTSSTQSTGLFGSTTATSSAPTTGLFGNTTTTSTAPGGLFGSTPTTSSASTGLFGSTNTGSAPSGGLFGSPATSTASTGLFGSNTTQNTGLFGAAKPTFGATSSGSTFGSTTAGGLFSKPATTGFGGTTGGGLFSSKPATGGLFGSNAPGTAQNNVAPVRQRDTLPGMIMQADAVVRSLTCPELYGDERDKIIGKLNQVAAALGTGNGFCRSGESVPYNSEGPFYRLKAIGYNTVSEFGDADGMVSLFSKLPKSEFTTSVQRQKLIDGLFAVLGSQPNMQPKIKNVKPLPDNNTELVVYVINKGSGTHASSNALAQILNEPAKKQQLESQFKIEKILSLAAMDKYQMERYIKDPPAGFDDVLWQQSARENPDSKQLIPYPIRGFEELVQRQRSQASEVQIHELAITAMQNRLNSLKSSSESAALKVSQQKVINKQLSHRLLRVLCMQLIQQRFGKGIDASEEQIQCALENINARLNAPQQIKPLIAELLDVLKDENSELRTKVANTASHTLSEADILQLQKYLSRCQDGLESLSNVVRENLKHVNAMATAMDL